MIVAAFGHPNPGDISLAYWPRHLENNIWGVVKGQVELQVRLDRELPDLPRKIGMAARQLLAAAELTDPTMPATGNNRRYCFYLSYIIENKKIFLGGRTFMAHPTYGLNELREMFLKFFETKEHLRLPSFSLIPQNDASLLLINSGMAPMKPGSPGRRSPPATGSAPARSASAPATSKTSARPPATALILRCWATSPSATTSKGTHPLGLGIFDQPGVGGPGPGAALPLRLCRQ